MQIKYTSGQELGQTAHHHYNNPILMSLEGEIHFDKQLSIAESIVVIETYRNLTGKDVPDVVYAPCAGTLRHIPSLLEMGIKQIIAVDLSLVSLQKGEERYGSHFGNRVSIYNTDIRNIKAFLGDKKVELAFLMGNSFGDVINLDGHIEFISALSASLEKNGVLIFDYVGNRYCPPPNKVLETIWEEKMVTPTGSYPVLDIRQRWHEPLKDGVGVLHLTSEVRDPLRNVLVPKHHYDKLIVPDDVLEKQFEKCGMKLVNLGPLRKVSQYHDHRIKEKNDLGMMGDPDYLYAAIKN